MRPFGADDMIGRCNPARGQRIEIGSRPRNSVDARAAAQIHHHRPGPVTVVMIAAQRWPTVTRAACGQHLTRFGQRRGRARHGCVCTVASQSGGHWLWLGQPILDQVGVLDHPVIALASRSSPKVKWPCLSRISPSHVGGGIEHHRRSLFGQRKARHDVGHHRQPVAEDLGDHRRRHLGRLASARNAVAWVWSTKAVRQDRHAAGFPPTGWAMLESSSVGSLGRLTIVLVRSAESSPRISNSGCQPDTGKPRQLPSVSRSQPRALDMQDTRLLDADAGPRALGP
jgi:hypothetical protein